MFDHLGIVVTDLALARNFYVPVLESLGIQLVQNHVVSKGEGWLVFADETLDPFFVVAAGRPSYWDDVRKPALSPIHISFRAPNRNAVDLFYERCLEQGGKDNGAPGERMPGPDGREYYAAYVIDPDGNNIEAGVRG